MLWFWDCSEKNLEKMVSLSIQWMNISNVGVMLDGNKLPSLNPIDSDSQNCNYNGWIRGCNREVLMLWEPYRKIIDCIVNCSGNFHDSKMSKWQRVYNHILQILDNYKVCNNAFVTTGLLGNKFVKTKAEGICGND